MENSWNCKFSGKSLCFYQLGCVLPIQTEFCRVSKLEKWMSNPASLWPVLNGLFDLWASSNCEASLYSSHPSSTNKLVKPSLCSRRCLTENLWVFVSACSPQHYNFLTALANADFIQWTRFHSVNLYMKATLKNTSTFDRIRPLSWSSFFIEGMSAKSSFSDPVTRFADPFSLL